MKLINFITPFILQTVGNLIALGLSCINFITPMKLVNKRLLKIKEKKDFYNKNEEYKKKYQEVRREIPLEFDRCNPVTKRKATEEWVNFIENRGIAEREEKRDEGKRGKTVSPLLSLSPFSSAAMQTHYVSASVSVPVQAPGWPLVATDCPLAATESTKA